LPDPHARPREGIGGGRRGGRPQADEQREDRESAAHHPWVGRSSARLEPSNLKATMSQTKRRRRTKHRGNAAGVVEARGRTGRKPTAGERKPASGAKRPHRLDKPPTWRGAFNRAILAVLIFGAVLAIIPSF